MSVWGEVEAGRTACTCMPCALLSLTEDPLSRAVQCASIPALNQALHSCCKPVIN